MWTNCVRRGAPVRALLLMAALATLAYLPSLGLPFISDDYVQVRLARDYGPVSAWPALASDALYRCRATSLVLTYWTERWFGLNASVFNLSSLLIHVGNTWLVFALGLWRPIGWRVSAAAAAFFAVYEGHQEAVIWYAALPELLVFLFVMLSVLAWLLWLRSDCRRFAWYAAALVCFLLALFSKESAVVVAAILPLLLVVERRSDWPKKLLYASPLPVISLLYALSIFAAKPHHLHLNDGTFSLAAPFWLTLANSVGRLFWVWGLLGLVLLLAWRRLPGRLAAAAALWIVITLLPYSFLTYMPRIPSRHTYLASAGLAFIVGAAFLALRDRFPASRRFLAVSCAALVIFQNCAYLWTRKQRQFQERAEPTEQLIRFAAESDGPIYLECFPYSADVAILSLEIASGRSAENLILDPADAERATRRFCFGSSGMGGSSASVRSPL